MNFFTATYTSIVNPVGATQSPSDTIQKLSERLSHSTLLSDRRAAVLSLKSLAGSWKEDVSKYSLEPLLAALHVDPQADPETGRALLETLEILCQANAAEDGKVSRDDLGLKNSDIFLSSPEPTHTLVNLLQEKDFFNQFLAVRLLSELLHNRTSSVQKHFLTSLDGAASVVALLNVQRDMTRTEALQMIHSLASQNADIQKILAFEGVFESLFRIIREEDGIEGSVTAQECLQLIDDLLRYNVSNQNYFRELGLPPLLPQLLHFPNPPPKSDEFCPQEFNLQIWSQGKWESASYVVGIIGILARAKGVGSHKGFEQSGAYRCLLELALSSNAPTQLKTQALCALPSPAPLNFPLTPYIPVPDTKGEEWDRLPPETSLGLLVSVILEGEYGGVGGGVEGKEGLELRGAGLAVFESYIASEPDAALALLAGMVPTPIEEAAEETRSPSALLLRSLLAIPTSSSAESSAISRLNFASVLFSTLIRTSSMAKSQALSLVPSSSSAAPSDDDEPPPTLLSSILGCLAMGERARALGREQGRKRDVRGWDRIILGYLKVLCWWLWDNPESVKAFLEEGGALSVIIEPIAQTSEIDPLVQGLSAFILGVLYEFNRTPGEITRATLYPIIHSRIGADVFVSRITQVREDDRFKAIGPDSLLFVHDEEDGEGNESEVWLDWEFVEFWKGSCYSVQRSIHLNPNATSAQPATISPETLNLIASLRDTIRHQASELETLHAKLSQLTRDREDERDAFNEQISNLSDAASKAKEVEKEQEDLLILLEEMSTKRKRDKVRMKEQGMEISEDEDDGEGDADEGDDEE